MKKIITFSSIVLLFSSCAYHGVIYADISYTIRKPHTFKIQPWTKEVEYYKYDYISKRWQMMFTNPSASDTLLQWRMLYDARGRKIGIGIY